MSTTAHHLIVQKLYSEYQTKGFISVDEALSLIQEYGLSLIEIDDVTGTLQGQGVIFLDTIDSNDEDLSNDDVDEYDRTRTDYEAVFQEVLCIAPNLRGLIEYVKGVQAPQHREWHILIPQAQNGNPYARNRLFDMYLRVVVKLALATYKVEKFELEDLIQEGSFGLLKAIDSYDNSRHGSFVSYLPWWVTQRMQRAIYNHGRVIRLPVHLLDTLRNLRNKKNELKMILNRRPYLFELSSTTGIDIDEIKKLKKYGQKVISLDQLSRNRLHGFSPSVLIDIEIGSPYEMVCEKMLRKTVNEALETLREREKLVLKRRYGFEDKKETLEEVGKNLGITRERVRQIESNAFQKLKAPKHFKKLIDFL